MAKCAFSLLIFLLSLSLHANPPAVCDNLATLACAPGRFEDGTGTVPSESEITRARDNIRQRTTQFLKQELRAALDNPDNSYFREIAKSALGLSLSPACSSTDKNDIKSCDTNLFEGLVNISTNVVLDTNNTREGDASSTFQLLSNNILTDILDRAGEQVDKSLATEPIAKKIQNNIFPQVKKLLIEQLNKMTIPEDKKRLMISKVRSITYAGSNCESNSTNLNKAFFANAFYDNTSNSFSYCNGLALLSSSEFTIAGVIAHELAHSIDPCLGTYGLSTPLPSAPKQGDQALLESETVYRNLISCLRRPESVAAANFGTPQSTDICAKDQINESFCDHMAAEILPTYMDRNFPNLTPSQFINGYSNVHRPVCSTSANAQPTPPANHPNTFIRINKILLVQPRVREQMGCPADPPQGSVYCSPNGEALPAPMTEPEEPGGMIEPSEEEIIQ